MELLLASTEHIPEYWKWVEPFLLAALAKNNGEFHLQDIKEGLESGKQALWLAVEEGHYKGCAVVEFRRFPCKKVCYIVLLGGEDFSSWAAQDSVFNAWVKANGAVGIAAYVRKGFVPVAKPYGYRDIYTIIYKDLHE